MVNEETFFAWLDGELDGEEAARVAAEVEADPDLAAKAERHRAMQARLKGAFDGLLTSPLPHSIETAAGEETPVVDLEQRRRGREQRRSALPQWAAVAAALAVGLFTGTMIPKQSDAPVELHDGKVYAAAAVSDALDTELASAPTGDVRINLTFRDQTGAICRTFTDAASSGLACRSGGRWQVRGLFAAPERQTGAYRMASGSDASLAALVDSAMAGEPLDAAQEKAAKDRGWR